MSEHISQKIAKEIDKVELERYYYSHLPRDTMAKFGIPSYHILNTILCLLEIDRMTPGQITEIQFNSISDEDRRERSLKISKAHTGKKRTEEAKESMRIAQSKVDHSKFAESGESTRFKKGDSPWNKGKIGVQKCSKKTIEKRQNTMRERGTFNSSKQEDEYYLELCEQYGEENIIRQYKEERYPFSCDFYIISEDLFIELNRCWTHGGMPFEENNEECLKKLALWQEKAETSKFYKNAIYTWTDLDVRKIKTAKENNLNYKVIY